MPKLKVIPSDEPQKLLLWLYFDGQHDKVGEESTIKCSVANVPVYMNELRVPASTCCWEVYDLDYNLKCYKPCPTEDYCDR